MGKLYALDGHVLLLGVIHWNNTSLHLAESRADYPGKSYLRTGSAMMVDGERQWVYYETLSTYGDDFGEIGEAELRFFRQRAVVDFAVEWMEKNRKWT